MPIIYLSPSTQENNFYVSGMRNSGIFNILT